MLKPLSIMLCALGLTACMVGPDYVRPTAPMSTKFKEAKPNSKTIAQWQPAKPQDTIDRGEWWKIFKDNKLNALEDQLNINNQTILNAAANYQQAQALVDEARASYFPTLNFVGTLTRQKSGGGSTTFTSSNASGNSSGAAVTGGGNGNIRYTTTHTLLLNATWEPDLWGSIGRNVEASRDNAEASAALLANTRLSAQASLAQYYFELRTLDTDQQLLDNTVKAYQRAYQLTNNQYTHGIAARSDVIQAQSLLEIAKSEAINNRIARGQYEHAIAVLIGVPPSALSLPPRPLHNAPPRIPVYLPSQLLERRPDIAQAERLMAQANAQIGVAVSAYFPTLTLAGSASAVGQDLSNWFSMPALNWSIGPQLAQTILDGGLRKATIAAARAGYQASVATYRQTVLSALQDVEDNLIALNTLQQQSIVQNRAAQDAVHALNIVINQYKAGIVSYSNVVVAQQTAFSAQKNAVDIIGLRMSAAVGLVKSLGGGWSTGEG